MKKSLIIPVFMLLAPTVVFAAPGLYNPTAGFAPDFPTFIKNVLQIFGAFAGSMAIIYVVFAGFKMVISQGDSEKLVQAKTSLQWTLSGMLLIFLSFALVYAVSVFIGTSDISGDIDKPNLGNIDNTNVNNPITSPAFGDLVDRILTGFLGVAGTIALMMIIINGFRYMLAGGNEEQTENAKTGLQWAVIGLVIIALAYVIVVATTKLLG